MNKYRRFFIYLGLAVAVVLISLIGSVLLFKDRIIRQFIAEANKHLNTPVKVGELDVSILRHFPRLSIVLNDVYVEDSHPGNYPLLTAKQLSFTLHPYEVYKGEYNIKGVYVTDGEANFKVDEDGVTNYRILKSEEPSNNQSSVSLELRDIDLRTTRFQYIDFRMRQDLAFTSEKLNASVRTSNDQYTIEAKGDIFSEKINIRGSSFLNGKSFDIETAILYDDNRKKLDIHPSLLSISKTSFNVAGHYEWKDKSIIDLNVDGKDTDIQTILSLLPETVSENMRKYRSEGNVYFKANLKGEIETRSNPALAIDFGFADATIFHPDYKTRITNANLKGSFSCKDVTEPSLGRLKLEDVRGRLNGESFSGSLTLVDFNNPDVIAKFKGKLNAQSVLGFYPVKGLVDVSGSLTADIAMKGRISLLKNRSTAKQVSTSGTIDLEKISFKYGEKKVPVENLTGNLQFSNNDLALSNVSGKLGKSDYLLNGFFKNIITFMLFDNQPVGIEADLKSRYLDVDELFTFAYTSETSSNDKYDFGISDKVYLNFNCDVERLKYKRFRGASIRGDLLVKNKVAVSRNLKLQTMGGDLSLSGIVDATNRKAIDVVCTSKLSRLKADSIFYVFENFDQTFILDKHLRGDVSADVQFELSLNENLRLYPETLTADIGAIIKNGELNNFEPLKKLNKYLDDESLSNLRFSDIKNDIHIENKTVYIPQMLINSNATSLRVSGTHTFDQRINYRIITPLRGRGTGRDAELTKAVDIDSEGQTRLFLKIVGTTDDYKIMYDTEAVRNKISSDLKREVKELKDAFKKKETEKKKEIELQEDEYFEW